MDLQTQKAASDADNLRERHAERKVVDTCRSATFLSIIKHFCLESGMTVYPPKGQAIIISASHVWAARKKFFARFELDQYSCRLTASGDQLVELFYNWLLHEYSGRYHHLASEEQQQWLKRIVMVAVARHLMETKYMLYLQGLQSFTDQWVCGVVCHLQEMACLPENLARMVHHIVDDPTQQTELIEAFYEEVDNRMIRYQFALPDLLPPLPEGTILPFALLMQPKEGSNE